MATFRVRFKLNPGRTGIALGKLSKQTENIEQFLRSLATDLGHDDAPGQWLAKDFKDGSFNNTAEYQAVVEADAAARFNDAVLALAKYGPSKKIPSFVSHATIDRFATLREGLDPDENIGIAVFDVDTGRMKRWTFVDRLALEYIGASVESEVKYVGAVMGRTHEWNKGAREPYIIIRELNTGELVKCVYSDTDYSKVAALFKEKTSVVVIQGLVSYNRITGKTLITIAREFDIAPDFSEKDFEEFFGCAPGLTGGMSTEDFISRGRDDE